jgi:pilus assembly protein CpaC
MTKHFALALLVLMTTSFASAMETIVLAIGRSAEWSALPGAAVFVSNGAIVGVRDLGSRVRVTAKKLGTAQLRSGSRMAHVQVLPAATFLLHERLSSTLRARRGVSLDAVGKTLTLRGRLLRWEDWRAVALAAGQNADYRFEAKISPEIAPSIRRELQALLREAHLPDLPLELTPTAGVTVPMDPPDLKARVERVLGPYGFRVQASASTLSLEPLVRVRIIVAEFRKSMSRSIGLKWPSAARAQLLPDFRFPMDELVVAIQALESRGLGKVLASPTLVCRSGKEAQFLAGGEFPIKIANHKSREVIWKRHGVLLKIRPRADFSGRMSIGIETEVSMIDTANTVDGVPGLLTNRIESHFDLATSRTIALSGLIKKEWGESSSGLPGLGRLPILGPLFSSRDYIDNKTELVVFVTPEVGLGEIDPAPAPSDETERGS